MHMTKHVFGVYSNRPGAPVPPSAIPPPVTRPVVAEHVGEATVAAYSIVHGRDGGPEHGLLVCDLPGGARTYAIAADVDVCTRAEHEEFVGARVVLTPAHVDGAFGPVTVNRVSA
jgi:acetyl-CoA C-acetyltransferase